MTIAGSLPLQPKTWLGLPESEPEKEFLFEIKDAEVDLSLVQPFVPMVKNVQGNLELNVKATGTSSNPQFSGDADLSITKMRLDDSPFSEVRDSRIILNLANDILTVNESSIIASGGKATIKGSINLASKDADSDPIFDVEVEGKDILLYRTKDLNFRGHPNLTITGPYSKAKIAGTLKIADRPYIQGCRNPSLWSPPNRAKHQDQTFPHFHKVPKWRIQSFRPPLASWNGISRLISLPKTPSLFEAIS